MTLERDLIYTSLLHAYAPEYGKHSIAQRDALKGSNEEERELALDFMPSLAYFEQEAATVEAIRAAITAVQDLERTRTRGAY